MASETTNYKLIKPDGEDFYNVEDFNSNADIVDSELKKNADSVNNLKEVAKTGNASDTTVTFTQAASRSNLSSGEKLSTSFGKIKKWFADIKSVAFTGSYNDLSSKPTSLPANGGNADTVDGKHASDLQNYNNLTNKPTSLPANGGNADTVDGKHASDLQNYNNLTNKPTKLPANGGNADTVDGKHASDLTAFKAFSSSNEAFKSRYIGYFSAASEGIEGISFKGESYKDSAPDRDFEVERYSRLYTNGKEWFFRLDQYNEYNGNWNTPTIQKLNGNADTVDGKHASDLQNYNNLINKPTSLPANGGTALNICADEDNSAKLYVNGSEYLRNKTRIPLIGNNGLSQLPVFVDKAGDADTVDGYHAYQFQNCNSSGNPEGTYLKSAYDESKGKFYLKSYLSSGQNGVGVYVDYAANSDRLQDRSASDFYSVHTVPIDRTTNPVTWDNGIYTVEEDVKKSNGYPFDSGWVHATIYVSGQRNTDPNTGVRRGYGVVRYLDNANNEFIKTQHWNENEWSEWRRIITDDVLSYKEIEPDWIGGGFTVMLPE